MLKKAETASITKVPADIRTRIMATSLAVIDFLMKGYLPQRKVVHRDYINYFYKGLYLRLKSTISRSQIYGAKNPYFLDILMARGLLSLSVQQLLLPSATDPG